MIKIYHNPRCKKSRAGLEWLKSKTDDFEIVKYLNTPFTPEKLKALIHKIGVKPEQMLRIQEEYYKKNLKGKNISGDALIEEMVNNPKLIQRPVIETETRAVIGDPPEEIEKIF